MGDGGPREADGDAELLGDDLETIVAAAENVLETFAQLLNALAAVLSTPAGQAAALDTADARSLPAMSKVLKRLWFKTVFEAPWPEDDEAFWLRDLLLVSEGSREGVLSFFGAGMLMCEALMGYARHVYPHVGLPVDVAWSGVLAALQSELSGPMCEHLQRLPADHLCSRKKEALISTNRLPAMFRRMFDLEGKKLNKVEAAGLGVAMLMPGSGMVALSGLGAILLLRTVQQHGKRGGDADPTDPLEALRARCETAARAQIRRKAYPIEIAYLPGAAGPGLPKVKICLYPSRQAALICAVPAGGFGADGSGVACVGRGERCTLQPKGTSDAFWLRVFKPGLIDVALHDGVEILRGGRVAIVPTADGEVKCYVK
mmetsp:Transcript_4142/g.10496  ORF Transcript_4142/g.10496 Transcript_4142/m.10496 type:complete len:373 (-) Transcript_4142:225-1343(-)